MLLLRKWEEEAAWTGGASRFEIRILTWSSASVSRASVSPETPPAGPPDAKNELPSLAPPPACLVVGAWRSLTALKSSFVKWG